MTKKVTKQHHKSSENTVETKYTSMQDMLKAGGDNSMTDVWKDFFGGFDKKVGEQLQILGTVENELRAGEAVSLKKEEKVTLSTEGHMEYFRSVKNADVNPEKNRDVQLDRKVEEIRMEIKSLLAQSKQLETTFKSVAAETRVVNAGRYHETFFTFVLSLLRSANMKLQEGASWLQTAKSKKQQRQYQNMAKKHGTSFTLNNERNVATQVG